MRQHILNLVDRYSHMALVYSASRIAMSQHILRFTVLVDSTHILTVHINAAFTHTH